MSAVIDHKQRKQLIITRSIILFAEQGYNGVTYQKIADSCGFARTILYKYFKNKREIFAYIIEDLNQMLLKQYQAILRDTHASEADRIEKIMNATVTLLYKEQIFLSVVLDYILAGHREGHPMKRSIRNYTYGVVRVLRRLVHAGIRGGEFRPQPSAVAVQNLYALLESVILRLTVAESADFRQTQRMIHQAVETLKL